MEKFETFLGSKPPGDSRKQSGTSSQKGSEQSFFGWTARTLFPRLQSTDCVRPHATVRTRLLSPHSVGGTFVRKWDRASRRSPT
mmetsp:Transcript_59073/g.122192  ORF Transcript_59073/g.122192 Transcript_59073/m.122192 type:complete len:84 (+) Transcript_59073:38-289(+)